MCGVGKGSRFGRVMRKAAGIGANIGGTVAQNTVENPDATFEDHQQSVLEGYASSLGMKPLHHGVGKVGQKIGDHVQSRRSGAGHAGGADGATPQHSEGQTFNERIGLESGAAYPGGGSSLPLDGGSGQPVPASAQHGIPDTTTRTDAETAPAAAAPPPRKLRTPSETQEAIEGIKRLQDKAKAGDLNVEEQRELDQHEKTRATARTHHLETEKKALSEQNPPRELNPFKAQALENERAVLKRPVPGEAPVSPQTSIPGSSIEAVPGSGQPSSRSTPGLGEPERTTASCPEAQVALKARDAELQHPETGVDATRTRIQKASFVKTQKIEGTHINQVDHLRTNDGLEVVHKPEAGQVKEKHRAGIEPATTGKREVAASQITQALGIDLVPPTTMLTHNGQSGSAQHFKEGMIDGKVASKPPYNIEIDPKTQTPVHLPDAVAENWQLTDDLLMHSDRHKGNYMLHLNGDKIIDAALVDNGYSLPANTGVVEKRFPGPREGQPISPLNQERLHRTVDNEKQLRQTLSEHLESEALEGLFARAKALLARGTYGNFKIDEINAHLPPEKQRIESVSHDDRKQ